MADSIDPTVEEPLFDPSLKKRKKKKQVAFNEDPLGPDGADDDEKAVEAVPSPAAVPGPSILKETPPPVSAQEEVAAEKKEDDFDAMFGDLKKKKKKKAIPMDLELVSRDVICI